MYNDNLIATFSVSPDEQFCVISNCQPKDIVKSGSQVMPSRPSLNEWYYAVKPLCELCFACG